MKEKIIKKANDMFLNLGFKSITMDDLASEMGISKKTIYAHFQNKTKLVEATTDHLFCAISDGIDSIIQENYDPIEELYAIKTFVMHHLKNEKTAPQYQLQKYYPKIHQKLKAKQFDVFQECVVDNLKRAGIKDQEMFPNNRFPVSKLMDDYLEYHILGITTEKGRKILNNLIKENQI